MECVVGTTKEETIAVAEGLQTIEKDGMVFCSQMSYEFDAWDMRVATPVFFRTAVIGLPRLPL